MDQNRNNFPDKFLSDACATLNIKISNDQKTLLNNYLVMMQKWNNYSNITSIKDYKDMLIYHILDSISVLPTLDSFSRDSLRLCDVGSGAGLPGIVLAIMRPEWKVICIDSVFKKTSFLRHVASTSLLSNVVVHHSRIEDINSLECDVIISRAFSSLYKFVKLSSFHAKKDGILCSMKGLVPKEEIKELSYIDDWRISNIEELSVPGVCSKRCLVIIGRTNNEQ